MVGEETPMDSFVVLLGISMVGEETPEGALSALNKLNKTCSSRKDK